MCIKPVLLDWFNVGAKLMIPKGLQMTKENAKPESTSPMAEMLEAMQAAKFTPMPMADWIENMSEIGGEMLRFMTTRIGEDIQTQSALMHAKDVAEARHIQAQFFQKAMDDYATETAKLMEKGRTIAAQSGVDPVAFD